MQRIRPHIEHGPEGTAFVAAYQHGESRNPFAATVGPRCAYSRIVAPDGSWVVEIHWPDVMGEQLTFPPAHGTWRHEGGKWVPHDPADPAQAALLVQDVPDPPEVAQRRLEARIAALEAAAKAK